MTNTPFQDIWADIVLGPTTGERLGYPTQKPLALLERIISASSNPGDLVLDPFCGCGTTVDAAQKLGRRWIGIDVTHRAVSLIERRLKDRYGNPAFTVQGVPRDLAARDKHQFQWWAVSLVDAVPQGGKKKGADPRHAPRRRQLRLRRIRPRPVPPHHGEDRGRAAAERA